MSFAYSHDYRCLKCGRMYRPEAVGIYNGEDFCPACRPNTAAEARKAADRRGFTDEEAMAIANEVAERNRRRYGG